jgi:hypothetical protein
MDSTEQQASGPYAPPKARVDAAGESTKRHPWLAVALAVLSPVYPMLYVARGWRALAYLAALALPFPHKYHGSPSGSRRENPSHISRRYA